MTLNGKVIAQGAPSKGDRTDSDIQNGRKKGTESYLLPWIWDSESGEKVAASKEKLITGIQPEEQQPGKFRTDGRT